MSKDLKIIQTDNLDNVNFTITSQTLIDDSHKIDVQRFLIILLTKSQTNIFAPQLGSDFCDAIGGNNIENIRRRLIDAISFTLWYIQNNIETNTIEEVLLENIIYSKDTLYITLKFIFNDNTETIIDFKM